MPCDTQRTITVDDKKFNLKLLLEAMNSDALKLNARLDGDVIYFRGGNYRHTGNGGQFTYNSSGYELKEEQQKKLKAEYACATIKSTAKQNGWLLTTVKSAVNAFIKR